MDRNCVKNQINFYGFIRIFLCVNYSNSRKSKDGSAKPKLTPKVVRKKKQASDEDKQKPKLGRKCTLDNSKDDKKLYIPRRIFARRMKAKRPKNNVIPMNFGPLVDCR